MTTTDERAFNEIRLLEIRSRLDLGEKVTLTAEESRLYLLHPRFRRWENGQTEAPLTDRMEALGEQVHDAWLETVSGALDEGHLIVLTGNSTQVRARITEIPVLTKRHVRKLATVAVLLTGAFAGGFAVARRFR